MFCHKMLRLQLGPEIHLTVLFLHKVLKQTRNIDTFGRDSFQNFFHTSTWNVINNEVFHGRNPLIRPGKHNNAVWRARQLQIVASFVHGKTCLFRLQRNNQVEPCWIHFFHHCHVIFKNVIFFNFEASFGVGWLTSPFQQKNFFHIEQWFAVNLPDGQTAMWDGSNLNACRLRSSQSIGQFYAKSGKWKVSTNDSGVQPLWDGFWTSRIRAKFCGPEALPLVSPRTFAQVLRTLQPANWTLKIDLTVLHFDGTITNPTEIGLGRLLPS